MKKAIVIAGPTATGKSEIAIRLAEIFPVLEIVSADSMQLYAGMDIGTAKVPVSTRERIIHHMLDLITVEEEYSVALYKRNCVKVINEILLKNRVPLIVGGSGLYIRAVTENFPVEESVPANNSLRDELSSLPIDELRMRASKIDPDAVKKIGKGDRKRLVRVIEYYFATGRKISETSNKAPLLKFLKIGITMDRNLLYSRINERVEKMFREGFVDEVKELRNTYKNWSKTALQAIGYKEILDCLDGKISLEDAKSAIKKRTRNFAKRQITWFKKEPGMVWIYVDDFEKGEKEIRAIVEGFLNENRD